MNTLKNTILKRPGKKPILYDLFYEDTDVSKPLVIFCHGYKGFKDWGTWDLVAEAFAKSGFTFLKFNFSHNGGTMEEPIDFPDLNAFAENNYTLELEDLHDIIDAAISREIALPKRTDLDEISVIGHSRGGGIVAIAASENTRIKKVITWASVSDYKSRFVRGSDLEKWKTEGVRYVLNGRTKEQMPHHYQFYTNFIANESRLTIANAVRALVLPHLIIHGTTDESVAYANAEELHQWNPKSSLYPIENANHVFGGKHPWEATTLPDALQEVVTTTISFIKTH